MKIVAFVHFYIPYRNAGSETMLHTMLEALANSGHDVLVVATDVPEAPPTFMVGPITVHNLPTPEGAKFIRALKPDVIISHHDRVSDSVRLSREIRCKFVFLVHNDMPQAVQQLKTNPDLVVYNTEWIAEKHGSSSRNEIIVHPPVFADRHRTSPGNCITLVNLNEHKGGVILQELARRMPDKQFLGVIGGHGVQIVPTKPIDNLEIINPTQDMARDVWSRTRILLVPSFYESYGMVGVEAMASGIPVVANPTPGLSESLSYAGTFVPRSNLDEWETAIRLVERFWDHKSELARLRSAELDPHLEMRFWVQNVEDLKK